MDSEVKKQNIIEKAVLLSEPVKNAIDGIIVKGSNGCRIGTVVCVKPGFMKLMKRVAWMLTASMIIMLAIVTSEFTLALRVTLDGQVVGYTDDINAASEQVAVVEEHISAVLGETYELEGVQYSRGFVRNNDITKDISSSLMVQSDVIEPLYVVSVGGVEIGAIESTNEYEKVLDRILTHYNMGFGSAPTISTEITLTRKEAATSLKMTADELTNALINARDESGKPLLSVISEHTETKTEVVEYEVVIKYDDTKYLDYSEKIQDGRNGRSEITTNATYENGVLANIEVLKENVLLEKKDEIYVQGTKEIPYWRATGEFVTPVENIRKVTSGFGWRHWSKHTGVDLAGKTGEPILASDSGTVTFAGSGVGGYGKMIIIDHENGYQTYYAHNSKLYVKEGDHVVQGDVIAALGSTGNSTGPHLHFEILYEGEALDPADFVTFKAELN